MKLDSNSYKEKKQWEEKGYQLGDYSRDEMIERTLENPSWVHFGAGNIFRAFHANLAEKLLEEENYDRGIVVVEGFDYEIIEKMYRPHDNLSILVTLKSDGSVQKQVLGSIAESYMLDSQNEIEFCSLKKIFAKPSLQMATFTITEKGYALTNSVGETMPLIAADYVSGPVCPVSYLGKVAALLYERFCQGELPIAMVSTDNCSHNGDKLKQAMLAYASAWVENSLVDARFISYLEDERKVSFPWTMIDKITPRPDASVEEMLADDKVDDLASVITSKNTHVACFVNAEESEYLVIEDSFPNGRVPLERAGVIFTTRNTVDMVERMKVCTCLNPLHTALAVMGCLLGYERISEEMKHPALHKLVCRIGYEEGLPVVTDPKIIHPREFIDTVVHVRIPNPFMPDTPQRIATDTSQKLAIRYGQTILNYQKQGKNLDDLEMIPLVYAGWLRYLMGIDDNGNSFEISPDPLLPELTARMSEICLGEQDKEKVSKVLQPILDNEQIFGLQISSTPLYEKVLNDFMEMIAGNKAVEQTIEKEVLK